MSQPAPASTTHARGAGTAGGSMWSTLAVDALLALAVWALTVPTTAIVFGYHWDQRYQEEIPAGFAWLLGTAICLVLVVRRTAVVASAALMAGLVAFQLWNVSAFFLFDLVPLISLYTVAARARDRRIALGALVVALVLGGYATWWIPGLQRAGVVGAAMILGLIVIVWMLGNVSQRQAHIRERQREQDIALARDREQRLRLVAQQERAAIAREMHDVIAHSLSVVVVQAEGGAYAGRQSLDRADEHGAPADPGMVQTVETLETIAATARSALAETRRLVGVLRDESAAAAYSPMEGLAQIDRLVSRLQEAGVPVETHVDAGGDLPRDVDFAAYRIVQEGLTNIIKHAGPGVRAWVIVARSPGVLQVVVADDGVGPGADDGAGHGLVGMRERVHALGGHLVTGTRPGGGFQVTGWLPLTEEDESEYTAELYGYGGVPLHRRPPRGRPGPGEGGVRDGAGGDAGDGGDGPGR